MILQERGLIQLNTFTLHLILTFENVLSLNKDASKRIRKELSVLFSSICPDTIRIDSAHKRGNKSLTP